MPPKKEPAPSGRPRAWCAASSSCCYPPGIPILAPGERITKEILNYIEYAKAKGCSMTGPEDPDIERLNVLA